VSIAIVNVSARRQVLLQLVPLFGVIAVLGIFGEHVNLWLRYQRDAILAGDLWRLITAHLVHLGWVHTLMNLLALLLILGLFGTQERPRQWWFAGVFCALMISFGFLVFEPKLAYYAGLSGTIHGLLLWVLLRLVLLAPDQRKTATLLIIALLGKLMYEHSPWYSPDYLQTQMQAPVIVNAHLYGALAGGALALFTGLNTLRRARAH